MTIKEVIVLIFALALCIIVTVVYIKLGIEDTAKQLEWEQFVSKYIDKEHL